MIDAPSQDEMLHGSFMEHQLLQQMYEYRTPNDMATDAHLASSMMSANLQNGSGPTPAQQSMTMGSPVIYTSQASASMWPNVMVSPLSTSFEQTADFQLVPNAHPMSESPTLEEFSTRRSSMNSTQDVLEWQEKARNERRKVQNRTAQRAYRERKEKALSDLRELLDHKESQYQTLQKEHLELQKKYTSLLKGSSDHESDEFKLLTCNPRECFQHKSSEDSLEGLLLQQDQG